jgi:hypothetical protein
LHYHKTGGARGEFYYSKGDLSRLKERVKTMHGDLMPLGLYIPFESAWKAVKEFIERDGALPNSIEWIAGEDIPDDAFPDPYCIASRRVDFPVLRCSPRGTTFAVP